MMFHCCIYLHTQYWKQKRNIQQFNWNIFIEFKKLLIQQKRLKKEGKKKMMKKTLLGFWFQKTKKKRKKYPRHIAFFTQFEENGDPERLLCIAIKSTQNGKELYLQTIYESNKREFIRHINSGTMLRRKNCWHTPLDQFVLNKTPKRLTHFIIWQFSVEKLLWLHFLSLREILHKSVNFDIH